MLSGLRRQSAVASSLRIDKDIRSIGIISAMLPEDQLRQLLQVCLGRGEEQEWGDFVRVPFLEGQHPDVKPKL
jgi:hypothetical protein